MKRRRRFGLLALCAATVLAMIGLLQTQFAAQFLLKQTGRALGLELAAGNIHWQLWGTPQLELRDLDARMQTQTLLRAKRIFVALPWRTLRSFGKTRVIDRITLDFPDLDLPTLQRWLAARPPSASTRLPELSQGLQVRNGRIRNDDWQVDQLQIRAENFLPDQPLHLQLQGRYQDAPIRVLADLDIRIASVAALLTHTPVNIGSHGSLRLVGDGWQIPAQVALSGPLRIGKDSALLKPAKLGLAGHYTSGDTRLPFRLGLYGPLLFNDAHWRFVPATVVLTGSDRLPQISARGQLVLGKTLRLRLDGRFPQWPTAWPALPLPPAASDFHFNVRYDGNTDFSNPLTLLLQHDATQLDTQLRIPQLLSWLSAAANDTPLPPLQGTLTTPHITLDGVEMKGVEMSIEP